MLGSMLVAAAAASLGQCVEYGRVTEWDRPIATAAPYPQNIADDVRRPGFNGRLWVSRPIVGPGNGPYASPATEAYGAYGSEDALVYARVGLITIGITPWERDRPENLRQLRRAQDFWLAERGYTGGVRTHVNDLYARPHPESSGLAAADTPARLERSGLPEPRGVIELSPETPRVRSRIRVEAEPRRGPEAIVVLSNEPVRVSAPAEGRLQPVARVITRQDAAPVVASAADAKSGR